jgi:hypothetical protein
MGAAHEPRSGCPINATIEVFGDCLSGVCGGWSGSMDHDEFPSD